MNQIVLTDSCFWLGLLDPSDQYHSVSNAISDLIEQETLLIPWPCLYETISTHLARRRERLLHFEEILVRPRIVLLDDNEYKTKALNQVFYFNRNLGYTYSLADSVIREILKDASVRINYLVTYNQPDFHDICSQRQIEIISE